MDNLVKGIFKGILAMSLSDGDIQGEEKELMRLIAERFDLPEEELAEAIGDARKDDVDKLRKNLDHEDRMVVAQYAVMAAWADGHVDDKERRFLAELEVKFGLTKEEIEGLEKLGRDLRIAVMDQPVDLEKLNEIVESHAG